MPKNDGAGHGRFLSWHTKKNLLQKVVRLFAYKV